MLFHFIIILIPFKHFAAIVKVSHAPTSDQVYVLPSEHAHCDYCDWTPIRRRVNRRLTLVQTKHRQKFRQVSSDSKKFKNSSKYKF